MVTQTLNIQCAKCGKISKTNNGDNEKDALFILSLFKFNSSLNQLFYTCSICGESYRVNAKIKEYN